MEVQARTVIPVLALDRLRVKCRPSAPIDRAADSQAGSLLRLPRRSGLPVAPPLHSSRAPDRDLSTTLTLYNLEFIMRP